MVEVSPLANHDDKALQEKYTEAEETFKRARESIKAGNLSVEHRRYLNQLFTGMVATEKTACW
jgi:hypothetical protein